MLDPPHADRLTANARPSSARVIRITRTVRAVLFVRGVTSTSVIKRSDLLHIARVPVRRKASVPRRVFGACSNGFVRVSFIERRAANTESHSTREGIVFSLTGG
jgi:hypothetical protein